VAAERSALSGRPVPNARFSRTLLASSAARSSSCRLKASDDENHPGIKTAREEKIRRVKREIGNRKYQSQKPQRDHDGGFFIW
jgi:hypothetical protein